jgi:hypothetical protein
MQGDHSGVDETCNVMTPCMLIYVYIQGIHKRMVRYQFYSPLKPHHSFVYALYIWRRMYVYGYACTYVCTYVFMYVCMYCRILKSYYVADRNSRRSDLKQARSDRDSERCVQSLPVSGDDLLISNYVESLITRK